MASDFYQEGPRLTNQYDADPLLAAHLRWRLPETMCCEIEPALHRLGGLAASEWLALDTAAESDTATGGVDRSGKIFPIIKIVSGEGIKTLPEEKIAAIFRESVA